MIVAAFSVKPYDRQFLEAAAAEAGEPIEWRWYGEPLRADTARLAEGATAVCCFVNDSLDAACIETLASLGGRSFEELPVIWFDGKRGDNHAKPPGCLGSLPGPVCSRAI